MLARLIVMISQFIQISNHYVVHMKHNVTPQLKKTQTLIFRDYVYVCNTLVGTLHVYVISFRKWTIFLKKIEIYFTHHKIHPFQARSLVFSPSFATITTVQNIFITPEWNPVPLSVTPHSLLSHPLATTNLSVSKDLTVVEISYKWNHTLCGF